MDDPGRPIDLYDEHSRAATILLRGYLRLYILEQLHGGPSTGAEIVERLHQSCAWKPSPGTIYPLLRRLEREGLVESRWDTDSERGEEERIELRQKLEPQLRRTLRVLQLHIDFLFGGGSQ